MNVCIVSSYHLEVTAPYVKRLQELHEVDFYVPVNNSDKNVFLFDLDATQFHRTGFLDEAETKKATGVHAAYFSKLNRLWFFLYPNAGFSSLKLYRSFIQLALHIRKQRYDVVHVIGQFPFLLLIHLFNKGSVRVHTLHESVPHSGNFHWYEKFFLRTIAGMKLSLIFPSDITKKRFLEFTKADPEKCHTIYFGIVENYLSHINPAIREKPNQVLLFGFINAYKGVEYLAGAIDLIKKIHPDIHAVIAGRWSLPELKDSLKNHPNFTIIDKTLTIEEMTSLIQESIAVVCPYTSASNSGVIMTAFVFDKPVIASRIDGLSEVIEDKKNGLLVNPKDPEALAEAIEWLIDHERERLEMKNAIKEFKNNSAFSWNKITSQTIEVYNKHSGRL